jgi:hypothetical protein
MRTMIAGFMLAAVPTFAPADALTVYKYVDAMGRVTYTNVKPKQAGNFDVVEVQYDAPGVKPAAPPPLAAVPAAAPHVAATAAKPEVATLAVLPGPSLRLAAAAFDAPLRARRKPAPEAAVLKLDRELRLGPGEP